MIHSCRARSSSVPSGSRQSGPPERPSRRKLSRVLLSAQSRRFSAPASPSQHPCQRQRALGWQSRGPTSSPERAGRNADPRGPVGNRPRVLGRVEHGEYHTHPSPDCVRNGRVPHVSQPRGRDLTVRFSVVIMCHGYRRIVCWRPHVATLGANGTEIKSPCCMLFGSTSAVIKGHGVDMNQEAQFCGPFCDTFCLRVTCMSGTLSSLGVEE